MINKIIFIFNLFYLLKYKIKENENFFNINDNF